MATQKRPGGDTGGPSFQTAQVEALLAYGFEAADRATGETLDPEDQATLAAIGELTEDDLPDGGGGDATSGRKTGSPGDDATFEAPAFGP